MASGVVAVPLQMCLPLVPGASVSVGGSSFEMIVDTGSSSLGVAGQGCTNCNVTPVYQPGASAVDQKQTANSQFGSGSWSGESYRTPSGSGRPRRR